MTHGMSFAATVMGLTLVAGCAAIPSVGGAFDPRPNLAGTGYAFGMTSANQSAMPPMMQTFGPTSFVTARTLGISQTAAGAPTETRPIATATHVASTAALPFPGGLAPTADIVSEIQLLLTGLGYGLGAADGSLNLSTTRAIAVYQSRHDMASDGQISGPLLAALRADAYPRAQKLMGPIRQVSGGSAWSYIELGPNGAPQSVGVVMSDDALEDLPESSAAQSNCVDLNRNFLIEETDECLIAADLPLAMPALATGGQLPIEQIRISWLPQGRYNRTNALVNPMLAARWPGAWAAPHFSVYFFLDAGAPIEANGIGECGDLIDCRLFQRATAPIDVSYAPPNHVNVGAASPYVGNHLIDRTAADIIRADPKAFKHGFTYGSFDGRLTFLEAKATPKYMRGGPDACFAVSQPAAVERDGYYPTAYCLRARPEIDGISISLEGLIERRAPAQLAARQ